MFKKLLSLLLALMLVFSLAACDSASSGDDEEEETKAKKSYDLEDLVGTWEMTAYAPAEELLDLDGIEEDVAIRYLLTFDEDGTVTLAFDVDAIEDNREKLASAMAEFLYDMAEDEGYSKEDFDSEFEEANGSSVDEYVNEILDELFEVFKDTYGDTEETDDFEINEKQLTIGEYTFDFYIQGKKLVFTSCDSDDWAEEQGVELPVTLKRVSE